MPECCENAAMVVDGAYYRVLSKPKGQQACSVLLCKLRES